MAAKLKIRTWRGSDGQTRKADAYTVFVFRDRRRFKVPGYGLDANGRELSADLGRLVEKLLDGKGQGTLPPDLRRAVEALRPDQRASMARQGIIDAGAEGKALAEHVTDYRTMLEAKGNTPAYIAATVRDISDAFEACNCGKLGQVTTGKLRTYLAGRREDKPKLGPDKKPIMEGGKPKLDAAGKPVLNGEGKPVVEGAKSIMVKGNSARRHNELVTALRGFFAWMLREGRAFENPATHLDKLNEATDRRHKRRAMAPGEVVRLLTATAGNGELYGMGGTERALVYRLAVETGLRMHEISTLTRACIDLDAGTVTVRAGYSKRRREDTLPIRPALAEVLREHIGAMMPMASVFRMPTRFQTLKAFYADLAAAGIERKDAEGRRVHPPFGGK
jgi:integrase